MKLILIAVLSFGLVLPLMAADTPGKKNTLLEKVFKNKDKSATPEEAEAIAKTLSPAEKTKLLEIVNKGDEAALVSLPGIGTTRAEAIKKARPFAAPADLVKVEGVGSETFKGIVAHAKAGFPAPEKAAGKEAAAKTKPEAGKAKASSKAKAGETAKKAPAKAKAEPKKEAVPKTKKS